MSISFSESFINYDTLTALATAIITLVDAYRDIWTPKNWLAKFKIYVLTAILIVGNGLIAYLIYPIFAGSTGTPLGIEALLIGAGYFSILRVLSIKLKFGNGETPELSFSSLIYEPIQSSIFRAIDEIIDPFLEQEMDKLSSQLTLDELAEKVFNRIERANPKVLDNSRKQELKQWLSDVLANDSDTNEQRKKNVLAKVLVTKRFPPLSNG